MRILLVEDERALNDIIAKRLASEHYSVDACYDGEDALACICCTEYDAIILDILLPRLDGLSVLKKIKESKNNVPVMLLTAKDSISDKVMGLDNGADDYLTKPFSFEELLARIRVLLRRSAGQVDNVFRLADLVVDYSTRSVTRKGVNITLTGKEFDVLEYLTRNSGVVLTRDRIIQHLWNYDYDGGSNVVDVFIRYLRKKIDDGYDRKLIHTIRGIGYVFRENICDN